jgi:hypothetical protein
MQPESGVWSPYLVGSLIGLLSMATFYFRTHRFMFRPEMRWSDRHHIAAPAAGHRVSSDEAAEGKDHDGCETGGMSDSCQSAAAQRRVLLGGAVFKSGEGCAIHSFTARQMRTALVPPNANEFDMTAAVSTPALALPGT